MAYEIAPNIEVNGESLGATVDAFRQYPTIVAKYLLQYDVVGKNNGKAVQVDRSRWYPLDKWLAAYNAIAEDIGVNSLYTIGKKIPENAKFPAHITDIHSALASIDVAYHMNHRRDGVVMFNPNTGEMLEGIGHYTYRPVEGEQKAILECENPYPCEFDRGLIAAMAARFEPMAKTYHDSDAPCRKKGGRSCTYIVCW